MKWSANTFDHCFTSCSLAWACLGTQASPWVLSHLNFDGKPNYAGQSPVAQPRAGPLASGMVGKATPSQPGLSSDSPLPSSPPNWGSCWWLLHSPPWGFAQEVPSAGTSGSSLSRQSDSLSQWCHFRLQLHFMGINLFTPTGLETPWGWGQLYYLGLRSRS